MPSQDDHSEKPSTLPTPELNPLLNPLLGQNMGRWAEVYFTSPPERREQAVLDLLRELQGDDPTPEVAAPSSVSDQQSQPIAEPASRSSEFPVAMVRCRACGQENPASHRFCGMCGAAVVEQRPAADLNVTDLHVVELPVAKLHNADFQGTDFESGDGRRDDLRREYPATDDRRIAHLFAQDPAPLAPRSEAQFNPIATAVSERELNEPGFKLPTFNSNEFLAERDRGEFRDGREFNEREYTPSHLFEPVMDSRPYRLYVGIALAVVLVVAYVVWHNMPTSQSSKAALQNQPATAQPSAPTPLPPNALTAQNPSANPMPPASAPVIVPTANPAGNPTNNAASSPASNPTNNAARKPASPAATALDASANTIDDKSLLQEPVSANGAQELAIAQRYLNGAEGQARNSTEGAKWLWKAIAKHNADATLLLSDLYLKGDGVEKNCDQARVLLDAAAVRGMKGAGDRLRHLQAFGCQ